MPRPANRSRSLRKVKRKTPGGKVKQDYKRRKTTRVKCAICKNILHGSSSSKKLAKSKKTPTRIFAGNLCAKCTKEVIKLKTRVKEGSMDIRDVNMSYKKYVDKGL